MQISAEKHLIDSVISEFELSQVTGPEVKFEIERRWKIKNMPDLSSAELKQIVQGYLLIADDGFEIRLRKSNNDYIIGSKSDGSLMRGEKEQKLTEERFSKLWPHIVGIALEKDRHILIHDDLKLEIDLYKGKLAGLEVVEVEFTNLEASQKFQPLDWFGEEITESSLYRNKNLVLFGVPQS